MYQFLMLLFTVQINFGFFLYSKKMTTFFILFSKSLSSSTKPTKPYYFILFEDKYFFKNWKIKIKYQIKIYIINRHILLTNQKPTFLCPRRMEEKYYIHVNDHLYDKLKQKIIVFMTEADLVIW